MKMKDLSGQKFERLTALRPTTERKYGSVVWECQCDCGNIVKVSAGNLKSGNTKSCGCLSKEKATERLIAYNKTQYIDLTGLKVGKLTVLEPTNLRKCSNVVWKCQCECGNITYVAKNNLTRERPTQSCGCLKKEGNNKNNLTGQKFGKLTALEPTAERKHGCIVWKCSCECGNIYYVPSGLLTSKGTQSCGCLKSKGEEKIIRLLQKNNISFEKEKTFEFCIFENGGYPRFDFFINKKYIIEYDGEQHFHQTGWENLTELQARDIFKTDWCKKNNIPLIRIPYTRYDDLCIEDLLLETSQYIVNH